MIANFARQSQQNSPPGRSVAGRRCMPGSAARALLLLLAGGAGWLGAGCERAAPPAQPSAMDTAERGPLKLSATATPSEAWYGDAITLELRFVAPDDYLVRFPAANELGELEASAGPAVDPRPAATGGREWRQSYVISALTAGTLEIPPAVVKYARKPTEPAAEPVYDAELATGTLKVNVRSALTTQDSARTPRDITGARLPPERTDPWRTAAWIGGAVAFLAAAYIAYRLIRRRLSRPAAPLAPEVWARRALQQLSPDWIDAGRGRDFFYRISEIVRGYIERKFGLAAPEMTTEEFFTFLARGRNALPYDAGRLNDFLNACDIVKYAAFAPTRPAAEQALATARAFVDATATAASPTATLQNAGGLAA